MSKARFWVGQRVTQWAEWIISDLEASAQPRKRGRGRSVLAPIEKEAA